MTGSPNLLLGPTKVLWAVAPAHFGRQSIIALAQGINFVFLDRALVVVGVYLFLLFDGLRLVGFQLFA